MQVQSRICQCQPSQTLQTSGSQWRSASYDTRVLCSSQQMCCRCCQRVVAASQPKRGRVGSCGLVQRPCAWRFRSSGASCEPRALYGSAASRTKEKRTTLRVRGEKFGETRKVFRTTAGGVGCRAGWRAIEFVSLSYYFRGFPPSFGSKWRKRKEKKTRQAGLSASRLGPINGRWQASRTWSPVCWFSRQKSHWGQKSNENATTRGRGLLHLQRGARASTTTTRAPPILCLLCRLCRSALVVSAQTARLRP